MRSAGKEILLLKADESFCAREKEALRRGMKSELVYGMPYGAASQPSCPPLGLAVMVMPYNNFL
jgi:hypothetical protein